MKLSVIIPVYNSEQYLPKCLESVLAACARLSNGNPERENPAEIICVNDGSTDDSAKVLEEIAEKNSCIRIISQENAGVSVARNVGLEAAKGEWVHFMDSDDCLSDDFYTTAFLDIDKEPSADIVTGAIAFEWEDGTLEAACNNKRLDVVRGDVLKSIYRTDLMYIASSVADKFFKRNMLSENEISFMKGLHKAEDSLFCIQALAYARCVVVDSCNVGYHYRDSGSNSLSHRFDLKNAMNNIASVAAVIHLWEKVKTVGALLFACQSANCIFISAYRLTKKERYVFYDLLAKDDSFLHVALPFLRSHGSRKSKLLATLLLYLPRLLRKAVISLVAEKMPNLKGPRGVLFVFARLNNFGGAHIATRNLIRMLNEAGFVADVLSDELPNDEIRKQLGGCHCFVGGEIRYHSLKWLLTGIMRKIFRTYVFPNWMIDPFGRTRRIMSGYYCVCVVGESSQYRLLVSSLPHYVRKVIHIHTDYCRWIASDTMASRFTHRDHQIYSKYDFVALVGKKNALQFKEDFPEIRDAVVDFKNIINIVDARKSMIVSPSEECINIISLTRIDDESAKGGMRMIRIAKRLKDAGLRFMWKVYGGGEGTIMNTARSLVKQYAIDDCFEIMGNVPNARDELPYSDLMVLLSHYEGLPNVIYESFIAGTPVFSTRVGFIDEQIKAGENGWLVDDEDDKIFEELKEVISDRKMIDACRSNLQTYKYDNDSVLKQHIGLLHLR